MALLHFHERIEPQNSFEDFKYTVLVLHLHILEPAVAHWIRQQTCDRVFESPNPA